MSNKRNQQTLARRRSILAAALDCFRNGGADAVTIEAVSKGSGASVGSIYHHFGNKDKLLAGLYGESMTEYRRTVLTAIADCTSLRDHVRTIVSTHIRWVYEHPTRARVLLSQSRNPEVRAIKHELREATTEFIRELWPPFKEAMTSGQILQINPKLLPALIIGPAQELARQFLGGVVSLRDFKDSEVSFAESAWLSLQTIKSRSTPNSETNNTD